MGYGQSSKRRNEILQAISRHPNLSNGGKVLLLEIVVTEWSGEEVPAYSELTKTLGVSVTTLQRQVSELEEAGVLDSVREANNRKHYTVLVDALIAPPVNGSSRGSSFRDKAQRHRTKLGAEKEKIAVRGGLKPWEVSKRIEFHRERSGMTEISPTSEEAKRLKSLCSEHGVRSVLEAVDAFAKVYKRRRLPLNFKGFFQYARNVYFNPKNRTRKAPKKRGT